MPAACAKIFYVATKFTNMRYMYMYIHVHTTSQNWEKEFTKWLGSERIKVYAVSSEQKVQVRMYYNTCTYVHVRICAALSNNYLQIRFNHIHVRVVDCDAQSAFS